MTKAQLNKMYEMWAEKHDLFAYPEELDNAVSLISFDTGQDETKYSGTQLFAVTKHKKIKIHMFVFALNSTWLVQNDFDDDVCTVDETYRKVFSF